jgi:hypothetical protein
MLDLERMKDMQGNTWRITRLSVDFVWGSGNWNVLGGGQ